MLGQKGELMVFLVVKYISKGVSKAVDLIFLCRFTPYVILM